MIQVTITLAIVPRGLVAAIVKCVWMNVRMVIGALMEEDASGKSTTANTKVATNLVRVFQQGRIG